MARNFLLSASVNVVLLIQTTLVIALVEDCIRDLKASAHNDLIQIKLTENTIAGEVLMNITTHGEIDTDSDTTIREFIEFAGGNIVARVNFTLDGPGNEKMCRDSTSLQAFRLWCKQDPNKVSVQAFFGAQLSDDYTPHFTTVQDYVVSEAMLPGWLVLKLEDITVDEDCFNEITSYLLDSVSSQTFEIKNKQLLLKRQLDFEMKDVHYINLTVTTKVTNVDNFNSNSTILTVRVEDADDMNPVFDVSQFVRHVTEDLNVSSLWLHATPPIFSRDGDVGINTTIVYSVISVSPDLRLDIHNETGAVKVLQVLDRENVSSYQVVVRAAQADLEYKSATATLSVIVDDVNDNRPVYTSLRNATIMEDAPDGRYVTELTGSDRDKDTNAEFDFVLGRDDLGAFKIVTESNRTFLAVKNNTALRGRSLGDVQIKLVEREPSSGGVSCDYLSTCAGMVTVHVIDVNDNSPQFTDDRFEFTVPADVTGIYTVGYVNATDADKGDNARIVYSAILITGPPACDQLKLDPTSGVVTTDRQLPAGSFCSWIIRACDSPTDPASRRCSSVYMSVTVIQSGNVTETEVTVPENVPFGTIVASMPVQGLHTTSPDFDIKNDLLVTKSSIDRERRDRYVVLALSGQVELALNITVTDINDNIPVFEHSVYVIRLDEQTKLDRVVLQVHATDADIGDNAHLEFSLVTGKEYFEINTGSGEIILKNFVTTNDSEFQLLVQDLGQPRLQSYAILRVFTSIYNETATLILPVQRDQLMTDRENVARKLSSILGVIIRIYSIESLGPVPDLGSKLYIGATSASGQPVNPTDLSKLLEKYGLNIYDAFAKTTQTKDSDDDGGLSVLEIVLICIGCVLLLAVVLFMILWHRSQHNYKQSKRLFDSLNRSNTIYDNPRKPSSTAAAVTNNDSLNAQRMLARLRNNGSVGHSSVTNLIPNQSNSNSGNTTPPVDELSQSDLPIHEYINVADSITGSHNSNENVDDTPSRESHETTNFGTNFHEVNFGNSLHAADPDEDTGGVWMGGHTPTSDRQRNDSSNAITSDNVHSAADVDDHDDDDEVAHILSENIPRNLNPQQNDEVDRSENRLNLDLMRPVPPESFLNKMATTDKQDTNHLHSDNPPEPEPDYAKKVRFSEATTAMDTAEPQESQENSNKHTSLGEFLSRHGSHPNSDNSESANTSALDDTIEELTSL